MYVCILYFEFVRCIERVYGGRSFAAFEFVFRCQAIVVFEYIFSPDGNLINDLNYFPVSCGP